MDKLENLLQLFEEKKATPEQVETLFDYLKDPSNDELILAYLENRMKNYIPQLQDKEYWLERLSETMSASTLIETSSENDYSVSPPVKRVYTLRRFLPYAAAILIILSAGAYLLFNTPKKDIPAASREVDGAVVLQKEVAPGSDKAILTLADGTSIELDKAVNGTIAQESGANIIKKDGQIVYDLLNPGDPASVAYNTMRTPRGGQYKLALPDGTNIWLNAASSVTFPTAFVGEERKISITGEVYLEVTRNSKMPFKVKVNDNTEIEVLGTHFNVNAYDDESSINTTLLEGSIRINKNGIKQTIVPGQQAQIRSSAVKVLDNVNTDQVVAWKDGAFSFKNDDLGAILRQLSRWYDIDFEYKGDISERKFSGKMGRDLSLSQVLNFLKEVKLQFVQENKKIIVKENK